MAVRSAGIAGMTAARLSITGAPPPTPAPERIERDAYPVPAHPAGLRTAGFGGDAVSLQRPFSQIAPPPCARTFSRTGTRTSKREALTHTCRPSPYVGRPARTPSRHKRPRPSEHRARRGGDPHRYQVPAPSGARLPPRMRPAADAAEAAGRAATPARRRTAPEPPRRRRAPCWDAAGGWTPGTAGSPGRSTYRARPGPSCCRWRPRRSSSRT